MQSFLQLSFDDEIPVLALLIVIKASITLAFTIFFNEFSHAQTGFQQ